MTIRKVVCFSFVVAAYLSVLSPNLDADDSTDFKSWVKPFLAKYCVDCHGDDTQEGDVAFHELNGINADNARLWKSIWEKVAVKEMPPKDEAQPTVEERQQLAELIVTGMQQALKDKGGYHEHLHPSKGNLLDHDLLFGELPSNLEPTSSPARIWRLHPQAHFTRLNELVSTEPSYNPEKPGVRAHGDHIPEHYKFGTNIYLGVQDTIDWVGSSFSLHSGLSKLTPVLSTEVKRGLQDYPHLYSVNSSETLRIANDAEAIIRFMAYGPEGYPFQFVDRMEDIDQKNKGKATYKGRTIQTKHGDPEGVFYRKASKRPITPVYDLMAKPGVSDERLTAAVDFLFEVLTLRPPTADESATYLRIVKNSVEDLGKEDGAILGLTPIFLDRAAIFRTELCRDGEPDEYGRVMLQGQELALAINAAFSYIAPDGKLKQALESGRLKTRDDVKREVTRILDDDSIRKPAILRFFREYFDYGLAGKVDKDPNYLKRAGGIDGGKSGSKPHQFLMVKMTASTDRLVELILEEDKNVLAELLTTDRAILPESTRNEGYFRGLSKDGTIVDDNGKPMFVRKGGKLVAIKSKATALPSVQAKDLPGIVVDNSDAKVSGKWSESSGVTNHVGSEYLFTRTRSSKVVYPVKFPREGKYEVRITIAQHSNRSSKTLVTVRHSDGEQAFRIDQRRPPGTFNERGSDGYFQSLGFFEFRAGQWDAVEISGSGSDGMVVADAVQFLAEGTSVIAEKETKPVGTTAKTIHIRSQGFDELTKSKTERRLTTLPTDERMGILTHPIWLVAHSDAMDNHAILRGKWIRERLLGGAIADVPITVDAMLPDEPTETLRHRMRVTREDSCWKCHQKMDPLGLPFEMFNHAGLFRTTELGKPVNTEGEITNSGDAALDGPVKNALEMIEKLSRSERVKQVFVRHAFRYWMGRNETINDAPVLQDAYRAYEGSGGSMKALLIELLTSDAFLYRKVK
ncbi:MAG: DUF1588 domain-containing protein [Dehalococcoidia bacterium]|nr:DUF1588 domain-containing protein [Dehalococcoidia bacterium]